jgi:pyoverdine/dityrosine biosynthesis protein Dit1
MMWKNMVEPDWPIDDNIIRRMRFGSWIAKDTHTRTYIHIHRHTHTLSKYGVYILFPRQQFSHERASMLCYTYTAFF